MINSMNSICSCNSKIPVTRPKEVGGSNRPALWKLFGDFSIIRNFTMKYSWIVARIELRKDTEAMLAGIGSEQRDAHGS